MQLKIESEHLDGVAVIVPEVFEDERGFFMETYRSDQFAELGLDIDFVQDNHSRSEKNVLRGLHFQWDPPMGKLMRVTLGSAYLVALIYEKARQRWVSGSVWKFLKKIKNRYGRLRVLQEVFAC